MKFIFLFIDLQELMIVVILRMKLLPYVQISTVIHYADSNVLIIDALHAISFVMVILKKKKDIFRTEK